MDFSSLKGNFWFWLFGFFFLMDVVITWKLLSLFLESSKQYEHADGPRKFVKESYSREKQISLASRIIIVSMELLDGAKTTDPLHRLLSCQSHQQLPMLECSFQGVRKISTSIFPTLKHDRVMIPPMHSGVLNSKKMISRTPTTR